MESLEQARVRLSERAAEHGDFFVSLTGLTVRGPWYRAPWQWLMFARFAVPSLRQAQSSSGNLFTTTYVRGRTSYTLTAWESKRDAVRFVHQEPHRQAVAIFDRYFVGRTYGYQTDRLPEIPQAIQLLKEHGREYGVPL